MCRYFILTFALLTKFYFDHNFLLLYKIQCQHIRCWTCVYAVNVPRQPSSSTKWLAPPVGVVKLNLDASPSTEGCLGLGVVAWNDKGEVLLAATRRICAWWPPEIAKGKALLFAIKLAKRYGYERVIFESDSQVLVNRLSKALFIF